MPTSVTFHSRLQTAWSDSGSLLCAGFDPLPDQLPPSVNPDPASVLRFCQEIAAAVAAEVCAFKPQFAHFAALGAERELAELIQHLKTNYPNRLVILDAKRGDVGSTAERYAVEAFERYDADAVTLNPYLGTESLAPYLRYPDRGSIVLCRTSNPDSAWLQDTPEDDPTYLRVARAAVDWNRLGNVMLVAGATYPEQLEQIRAIVGDIPLLVPGIGTQGGDIEAVLRAGLFGETGLVVNVSRGIIHASTGSDYAEAAESAAQEFNAKLQSARQNVLRS